MTWSYSNTQSSDKDKVRFLVGDTDTADQLVQDEEINVVLARKADIYNAAAEVCRTIAAKFARRVDKKVGHLSLSASQKAKAYLELAEKFESDAYRNGLVASPYLGGETISDMELDEENSDLPQPSFSRGMHDNPNDTDDDIVEFWR